MHSNVFETLLEIVETPLKRGWHIVEYVKHSCRNYLDWHAWSNLSRQGWWGSFWYHNILFAAFCLNVLSLLSWLICDNMVLGADTPTLSKHVRPIEVVSTWVLHILNYVSTAPQRCLNYLQLCFEYVWMHVGTMSAHIETTASPYLLIRWTSPAYHLKMDRDEERLFTPSSVLQNHSNIGATARST